ncbi:MAG: hypothetical protein ABIK73_06700 [candidate division WOR-3 bacterium]
MGVLQDLRRLVRDTEGKVFTDDELLFFYQSTNDIFNAAALALVSLLADTGKFGTSVRIGSFGYSDSDARENITLLVNTYKEIAKSKKRAGWARLDYTRDKRKQIDEVDRVTEGE